MYKLVDDIIVARGGFLSASSWGYNLKPAHMRSSAASSPLSLSLRYLASRRVGAVSLTRKGSLLPSATLSGRPGVSFGSLPTGYGIQQRPAGTTCSRIQSCTKSHGHIVWMSCEATAPKHQLTSSFALMSFASCDKTERTRPGWPFVSLVEHPNALEAHPRAPLCVY